METEHYGEDAALDDIAERIAGLGMDKLVQDTSKLSRTDETDLDITEQDESGELPQGGEEAAEVDAKSGDEAAAGEAPAFIEIPSTEEGGEAEKIPLTEAVEAIKAFRQMEGDIATAVTRAETEAQAKQDEITSATMQAFETVRTQAKVALEAMRAYMPAPPDRLLLDQNSGYYDPVAYYAQKAQYDDHLSFMQKVQGTILQAEEGLKQTDTHKQTEWSKREAERLARFIPEWKDDKSREAKKSEILDTLGKKYGLTKEELDDIVDHKAWRMLADLTTQLKAQTKAPEVRKHVQEKVAKIVQGRPSQERAPDGKFISDARKALKDTGSDEAFQAYLLRSGVARKR